MGRLTVAAAHAAVLSYLLSSPVLIRHGSNLMLFHTILLLLKLKLIVLDITIFNVLVPRL